VREMSDYSGELRADAGYHDLSKETLEKLVLAGVKELLLFNGLARNAIAKRWGEEAALECDCEVWSGIARHEIRMTREALNIPGDDLVTFVKCLQFMPSTGPSGPLYDWSFEFEGPGRVVLTFKKCPALDYYEQVQPEGITNLCQILEPAAARAYADAINPAIKMTPLKLPPRESPEEIACQWAYEL